MTFKHHKCCTPHSKCRCSPFRIDRLSHASSQSMCCFGRSFNDNELESLTVLRTLRRLIMLCERCIPHSKCRCTPCCIGRPLPRKCPALNMCCSGRSHKAVRCRACCPLGQGLCTVCLPQCREWSCCIALSWCLLLLQHITECKAAGGVSIAWSPLPNSPRIDLTWSIFALLLHCGPIHMH